ncbi:hypothetical protein SBA3_1340018 [Candidatus Sulfopaludibacter sp. SbA3]|nr:hypothetical protein SBA3_1340018 [Candidatus Sulfopaludibacter sp. SbA3]
MWIEVSGEPEPLWVPVEECRLDHGGTGIRVFCAEDAHHRFSFDVYEHRDLVFWTIQPGSKIAPRQTVIRGPLLLGDRNEERVILRQSDCDKEYWAPVNAVRHPAPPDAQWESARMDPILRSSLPEWVQFGVVPGSEGEGYFASALQWGHSRNARVRRGEEEASVTVVNTLGYVTRFIHYHGPQGTP